MKTKIFKLAAIMLVLAGMISCQTKSEADQPTTLGGTQWKLVGIVDETGILKVLEPKDCEKCYTLRFDTDSSFFTFSPANDLEGGYIADYKTYSFQITYFGGTKVEELGDPGLYTDPFGKWLIHSFSNMENELRLYYTDNKNYLLFKSQQP